MSTRTALNTELIMSGVTRRRQIQTQNSSSTFPTTTRTDTGSDIIAPHETNTQASHTLSDVFSRLECELNQFQPAIQTPNSRAAALATVDQDINAAKHLMLSLLTRRNMLVPTSILPAEILARIFHFTAFLEKPHSLGWVRVTHVCRQWRQIALDDSTLWTHFFTFPRNKDRITEWLSRARNAPLVIELDAPISRDTFTLFWPHISHTRELYLRNMSRKLYPVIIQELSTRKAPVLEHLELSVANASPIGMKKFSVHPFFKGPLSKLRIFCISQIIFPWSLIPRGLLTQLIVTHSKEVSTVTSKKSRQDDLNHLIDLLLDCPALEVLTLENCLPAMLSESSGGQTIHLSFLSRLSLGGSSSRVTNLLKMLKLSSSTTLRLNCTPEFGPTHNDHLLFPILLAHFNDPHLVKFRSLEINLGHMGDVIGMVASTSLPISPIPHAHVIQENSDAELSLSFHGIVEPNNKADILRRTCDVLSLSNVEFLSVYSPSSNQFRDLSEIFQRCTEVTTVQVCGHGTIGLLQALTPPPPKHTNATARGKGRKKKDGDNGSGSQAQLPYDDDNHVPAPMDMPIFPKLTSLLLETLDFADVVPGSGVLYNLILSVVQQRKANKTPLMTLCIDRCAIKEKQAKAIGKLVPDFRWDHNDDNYVDKEGNREDYFDYYDFAFDGFGYDDDYDDDSWDDSGDWDIINPSVVAQAEGEHGW